MKRPVLTILSITLIFLFASVRNFAQEGVKVRIAVNTGSVLSESGSADIIADPNAISNGGTADFKSEMALGIEAELITPIGDKLAVGVEVENAKYKGNNEDPIYYNYFVSNHTPIFNYNQQPLIYTTDVINLLGTLRIYPMGHGTFTPFLKAYGGLALIATDLQFKNPEDQVNIYDPLYSRGTSLSIAEPSRYSTPNFGGGAGFEYMVSGNISLNAELTFSYINTDILDGMPNFTYDETLLESVYVDASSVTSHFSIGLCYTFGGGPGSGKSSKSGSAKTGRTNSHLPFYRKR